MTTTASQDIFRAILRVSTGVLTPAYNDMGVTLEWDLPNQLLKGTFKIPIQGVVDAQTGRYIIAAQEFVSDRVVES